MLYDIKVELNGDEITNKVSHLEITRSIDAYCAEMTMELVDEELYDSIDFSSLPESPTLAVFTDTGSGWNSQGEFFFERPSYQISDRVTTTGVWGRSKTALLGEPFASKVNKTWDSDTSFYTIAEEMCDLVGLTWDSSKSEIADFSVLAGTFRAENIRPVEVLRNLLNLAYGSSAKLTTDRNDNLCIKLIQRSPSVFTEDVTDAILQTYNEDIEWPEFGNRIRISATGASTGYTIDLIVTDPCLISSGARSKLYARVTDQEGEGVNNLVVAWTSSGEYVTFDDAYANTQATLIQDEVQKAISFWEVEVNLPPSSVISVYDKYDVGKQKNLASGEYTITDRTIRLPSKLTYCDQSLKVTYISQGVATNWITAGSTEATEIVKASVEGQEATAEVYVGNLCECPPSIYLEANPSSILIKEVSSLLVYVEVGGKAVTDGRKVYMTIDSDPSHGSLYWTKQILGRVSITNEVVTAQTNTAGISTCELSMFPYSVSGVYRTEEDAEGTKTKTGSSIYSSHDGKLVTLSTTLVPGEDLIADYTAYGAAVNRYEGLSVGTDKVRTFIETSREEPTEASVTIYVSDKDKKEEDPPGCCDSGLCEQEGTDCGEDEVTCPDGKKVANAKGVKGCWEENQADPCEVGKVYGYKDGGLGCFLFSELDNMYGIQKVFCESVATEGCFNPEVCDECGVDDLTGETLIKCFKDGVMGCYKVEECDTSSGVKSEECSAGLVCCEHKTTGEKGCWPESQCATDPNNPDNPPGEHDKSPGTNCYDQNGNVIKCEDTKKRCCEKGGKKGCWLKDECDDEGPTECQTTNCSQNPTDECLDSRFGDGLADGCTCQQMCELEFATYGTTQGYDGGSMRPISRIVVEDDGYAEGTPAYYEKYNERKEEAMDGCRGDCGDCAATDQIEITGEEEITAPGGYQYVATGGKAPLVWEASKGEITQDGYLTLDESACGSVDITVTDACGYGGTFSARITNNGEWVFIENEICTNTPTGQAYSGRSGGANCYDIPDTISGKYKRIYTSYYHYGCIGGGCSGSWSSTCESTQSSGTGSLCSASPLGGGFSCDDDTAIKYCLAIEAEVYEWQCIGGGQ